MSRSARHLGLAVVLCVLGFGFWAASALADDIVLCKTWTGYVKARYGHCAWGETEIPLSQGSPKTFFVTSATFNGGLVPTANLPPYNCAVNDGLDAADCICQRLADASDMVPGGTYKAWLSVTGDLTRSPSTSWTQSTTRYVLVNEDMIAHDYSELTSGILLRKPSIDENGADVASDTYPIWTATLPDGTTDNSVHDCNGWTSKDDPYQPVVGNAGSANSTWTDDGTTICGVPGRLYCAMQ
jgi:hypothetical protein